MYLSRLDPFNAFLPFTCPGTKVIKNDKKKYFFILAVNAEYRRTSVPRKASNEEFCESGFM